jgi:predicted MPP superfamily phosphohydrolase
VRCSWLTDIHLNFLRPLPLKAFYDRIAAERPDALFVTGDIAESDSVVPRVTELARLAPVYFVLGNHDYYRSSIRAVRQLAERIPGATYMQVADPIQLTPRTVMIGVDGWGDARCGNTASTVELSDWIRIEDFRAAKHNPAEKLEILQRLGSNEARTLHRKLGQVKDTPELLVLTHVPPFVEACVYDDGPSGPDWQPWFTCIATGEVLRTWAAAHPGTQVTVLCGHSHGIGTFAAAPNLTVRTGGWPRGEKDYGNPVIQATLEIA